MKNNKPEINPETGKEWTLEEIRDLVEDIFYKRKEEAPRRIVLWRGCITHGWVEESSFAGPFHCGNPECESCNYHTKIFNEVLEEKFTPLNPEKDLGVSSEEYNGIIDKLIMDEGMDKISKVKQLIEYYESQVKDIERLLLTELRPKTRIEFSQSKRNYKRFVSELKELKEYENLNNNNV